MPATRPSREQHVVAEKIAVDRALRQLALAEARLEPDFVRQELVLRVRDERPHGARRLPPPRRSAAVGEARAITLRREVQPRERIADRGAMRRATAVPPARRRCGVTRPAGRPFRCENSAPVRSGAGAGTSTPCAREMRHQVQVERQLVGRQALIERQHEAAALGGDEVIRVLDAGGDRRQVDQRAERVAAEPRVEFVGGDGGIDGHGKPRRARARGARGAFAISLAQNENRTHIGTFSDESRLSRRMKVAPLTSGIRKYGRPCRGVTRT